MKMGPYPVKPKLDLTKHSMLIYKKHFLTDFWHEHPFIFEKNKQIKNAVFVTPFLISSNEWSRKKNDSKNMATREGHTFLKTFRVGV